jgi:4-hydroxy-3-methylbut-2-enyl diphosphate reductase
MKMKQSLLVLVPLRVEEAALRTSPGWHVLRTGMGPARARIAAARALAVEDVTAVVVVGVCAAVSPLLSPGDVVCATELRREGAEPVEAPASALLASALRRRGLPVHVGSLVSTDHVAGPQERRRYEAAGVLALDMESAWLADGAAGRPLAVLRVVVEPAGRRLADLRTIPAGVRALVNLRRASAALAEWADAIESSHIPDSVPLEEPRELVSR